VNRKTRLARQNTRADSDFATRLLAWFDRAGRHDLPWQQDPTPYRVWVSEIMLQQTQVVTVAPYYLRFIGRFPDLATLARARLDEVLHLWSGLGYYARARNLHRAARDVLAQHGGELPRGPEALIALPGIGRSTAAAILALAHGERHAILDGNVKRVLARRTGEREYPGSAAALARLWTVADALTPAARVGAYTQAIMDLGATVCLRRRPRCGECPVAEDCRAHREVLTDEIPAKRPHRARPRRSVCMLLVRQGACVLLERRPAAGLWGGLWGLPEFADAAAARTWLRERFARVGTLRPRAPRAHAFTHFDLDITPLEVRVRGAEKRSSRALWYNPAAPRRLGLAAPVTALIRELGD
jgi:A/G-specific adenine glycosylase